MVLAILSAGISRGGVGVAQVPVIVGSSLDVLEEKGTTDMFLLDLR